MEIGISNNHLGEVIHSFHPTFINLSTSLFVCLFVTSVIHIMFLCQHRSCCSNHISLRGIHSIHPSARSLLRGLRGVIKPFYVYCIGKIAVLLQSFASSINSLRRESSVKQFIERGATSISDFMLFLFDELFQKTNITVLKRSRRQQNTSPHNS